MIDNNAFGVGAAAAVPTAGTPHSKNRVAAATDESWSGALRKRYVISPVSPDGHGPEVTGSVAKLSGHLPTAASLVRITFEEPPPDQEAGETGRVGTDSPQTDPQTKIAGFAVPRR